MKLKVRFFFWKKRRTKRNDLPIALFDVEDLIISRRLTQVVLQFDHIGYSCLVRTKSSSYCKGNSDPWEILFWELTTNWRGETPSIVVCGKRNERYPDRKRIVFDDDIKAFPLHIKEPFYFPLHIHIKRISERQAERIPDIPKEMKIGAIFIGNADPKSYLPYEKYIHETFRLPTRLEVLKEIRKNFPSDVFEPESAEDLWRALEDKSDPLKTKIVLIDKIHIGGMDYLKILRKSVFHIWTCGDVFPYCHNQPEGMLCGVIPIFQKYPLYNGFEDKTNCLEYESFDGLNKILKMIVSSQFDETELVQMSQRVEGLYRKLFSDETFLKNVDSFLAGEKTVETYYVHPNVYKTVNKEKRRRDCGIICDRAVIKRSDGFSATKVRKK